MLGRYIPLLVLLFGCATGSSAIADETEQLRVDVPFDWVQVVDRTAGNLAITEYYPGNTTDDWQQKLTIEALSGEGLPDPLVYAEGLAEEQSEACNHFNDNAVFAGFENGYPTVVHMIECGQNKRTGKALLTMLKIILGNKALYTITRIWRLEPAVLSDEAQPTPIEPLPIDQAELAAWSHTLSKAKVCDTALQAHPCDDSDDTTDTKEEN
jgi:hypothetical protein